MTIYKSAGLDATNKVPVAQLGTGTPSPSTFLRGDRVWATPSGSVGEDVIVRKTAHQSTTGQGLVNCTGLSFDVVANGEYIIEYWLLWEPLVITVGIALAVNGPGYASGLGVYTQVISGVSAEQVRFTNQWGGFNPTTVAASILNNVALMRIIYKNSGVAGTFDLQFAAETSTGKISIRSGSILKYKRTY